MTHEPEKAMPPEPLSEILLKARGLWGVQKLDECIALLTAAQKDHPGDRAILRLLEVAGHERTEQRKNIVIAEARDLISAHRFEDARAAADAMEKEFLGDERAQKLRELIVREENELARQKTLTKDTAELQSLIAARKYSEAFALGQELLRKHPEDDANIFELAELARIGAAKSEQPAATSAPPQSSTAALVDSAPPPSPASRNLFSRTEPAPEAPMPNVAAEPAAERATSKPVASRPVPHTEAPATAQAPPISLEREYVAQVDCTPPPRNKRSLPIAVGIAAVLAVVFIAGHFRRTGPTRQETTLQQQAQRFELAKDWPQAITSYGSLAHLNGVMAPDATTQAARLQHLLDKENDLFRQAQSASAAGNFTAARDLYQQAAEMQGDRELDAVDGARRMNSELALSSPLSLTLASSTIAGGPNASKTSTASPTPSNLTKQRDAIASSH